MANRPLSLALDTRSIPVGGLVSDPSKTKYPIVLFPILKNFGPEGIFWGPSSLLVASDSGTATSMTEGLLIIHVSMGRVFTRQRCDCVTLSCGVGRVFGGILLKVLP